MLTNWKRAAVPAVLAISSLALAGAEPPSATEQKPKVMVVSVNGAEWDIIRPLLLRGEMPNLASVMKRGISGKLRTIAAPNCPKIYAIIETSTPPMENGITGFTVQGRTADTNIALMGFDVSVFDIAPTILRYSPRRGAGTYVVE